MKEDLTKQYDLERSWKKIALNSFYGTSDKNDNFFKTFEEHEKIWAEEKLKNKIELRQKKLESLW